MRREGLQARGIYKEVPRPSRRLGLATRQKIPYTTSTSSPIILYNLVILVNLDKAQRLFTKFIIIALLSSVLE